MGWRSEEVLVAHHARMIYVLGREKERYQGTKLVPMTFSGS